MDTVIRKDDELPQAEAETQIVDPITSASQVSIQADEEPENETEEGI